MKFAYGFLETTYDGEDVIECSADLCDRLINPEEICLVDVQEGGKIYCKLCGPCERYHRKKAAERENSV